MTVSQILSNLHAALPGWRLRARLHRSWMRLPNRSMVALVDPATTWLSPVRLRSLERHLRAVDAEGIEGDVVECGVAAGGSATLLGLWLTRAKSQRRLFLCDTFAGLPSPTEEDPDYENAVAWTGQCLGSLVDVRERLEQSGVDLMRVKFVEGLFQETLPHPEMRRLAFVHLDGDWYDSTITCLRALWPLLNRGGRIQLDDYGVWQGCRKATDEFLAEHPEVSLKPVDSMAVSLRKP